MKATPADFYLGLRAYHDQDLPGACHAFKHALARAPDCAEAESHLALLSLYDPECSSAERLRIHRRWAEKYEQPEAAKPRRNHGKLRIGYVRASLTKEPGGSFFRPIARNHDASAFDVFGYSDNPQDAGHVPVWRSIARLEPAEIAQAVIADEIDILVNIDGHFSCRLMLTFARHPAPVLISLSNYPASTGLQGMHAHLSDAIADPLPAAAADYTERLIHLPVFLPFDPPRYSPALATAPLIRNGFVTFGCFNNPLKISEANLHNWASLLLQYPESRIVFHHPHLSPSDRSRADNLRPAVCDRVLNFLLQRGIARDRIALVGTLAHWDHLELHNEIDLLLDTSPYSGVTTTLEALWMGVPVLATDTGGAVSRASAAILRHSGMPEFVDESAEFAVSKCHEPELRREVAARFRSSAFFDHKAWVFAAEAACRDVWSNTVA